VQLLLQGNTHLVNRPPRGISSGPCNSNSNTKQTEIMTITR